MPEPYPALMTLGAHIARRHGLRTLVGAGPMARTERPDAFWDLDVVFADDVGDVAPRVLAESCLVWSPPDGTIAMDASDRLAQSLDIAEVAVVGDSRKVLSGIGHPAVFEGSAGQMDVAVIDRRLRGVGEPAPEDFRVLAIVTAYNEADIIGGTIQYLAQEGVEVHLIDNWSTDETHEIAKGLLGRGLVGLERWPATEPATFDLARLLERVRAVAASSGADWSIHHDADERRRSPWPGVPLRDALWVVQQSGFNAVDHTVLNFHPVNDDFVPGTDVEAGLRHFEFGAIPGHRLQVRAWRQLGRAVDLASSGGHEARFRGRRVFPYNFTLKHYPVRSQTHGERKVHRERRARWNPQERAQGWHSHYDSLAPQHSFLRDASELLEFVDGRTQREHLLTLIGGVPQEPVTLPAWVSASVGRRLYRIARRGMEWVRDSRFAPRLRRPGRWLRRMARSGIRGHD